MPYNPLLGGLSPSSRGLADKKAAKQHKRRKTSKNKRLRQTAKGGWGKPKPTTTVRRTKRKSPTPKKR